MKARGVALLMGLVLLAALSLVSVMAANGMVLQRRMAANTVAGREALQHAALAEAEARAWLYSRADIERESGCTSACLLPVAIRQAGELPLDPEFESAAWWRDNAIRAGIHPGTGMALETAAGAAIPGWWLLSEIHFRPLPEDAENTAASAIGYYRLLARGESLSPGSVAVTESLLARPWEGDYEPAAYPLTASPGDFCRQFDPARVCGPLAWRQLR